MTEEEKKERTTRKLIDWMESVEKRLQQMRNVLLHQEMRIRRLEGKPSVPFKNNLESDAE